jgi:hypothetical protein
MMTTLRMAMACALMALTACAQAPAMKLAGAKASANVTLPAAAKSAERLELHIDGVLAPAGRVFQARVFVDNPAATAETPAEHPSYLGMITLMAHPKPAPRNIILPLRGAMGRAIREKATATVTVVPEGKEPATILKFRLEPARPPQ